MRYSGNFQQQSLMLNIKRASTGILFGIVALTTACTRMPVETSQAQLSRVAATSDQIQWVAQSIVGTTTRYVDSTSGVESRISVLSEYFSASGRLCRQFIEERDYSARDNLENSTLPITTENRLACQDKENGWIEIPVQSFAR